MVRPSKALLIYPPTGIYDRTDRCQTPIYLTGSQAIRPPLDLAYMAGALRSRGLEIYLRDYPAQGADWSQFITDFRNIAPDLLYISITTFSYREDLKALKIAKAIKPSLVTVAKGAHFKKEHKILLEEYPELDVAITGESEWVAAEIPFTPVEKIRGIAYRAQDGLVHVNPPLPPCRDLDGLPVPARDLLNHSLYRLPHTHKPYTTILASRGCPYSCVYCLVESVSGKIVSYRSPASMVQEIESCITSFGIRDFLFKADTFTINREWVMAFCREIITKNLDIHWFTNTRPDTIDFELAESMHRAGCWMLAMGVESGDQRMLDRIGKKSTIRSIRRGVLACKRAKIDTFLYFTIGLPWDTWKSILKTISFACSLPGDYVEFHPLFPFPGTQLYDYAQRYGLIDEPDNYDDNLIERFVHPFALSIRQVNILRIWGLLRFYCRPGLLFKTMKRFGPTRFFRLAFFGLWKMGESIIKTVFLKVFLNRRNQRYF